MQTQDKKDIRALWAKVRVVQPVHLLVLTAVFSVVAVAALRHNYQTMVDLRQAVYVADKEGGDTEGALRSLRQHVYAHMNTDLSSGSTGVYPPLQLKYTYERLAASEQAKTKQANEQIYSEAQAYCEKLHPESFSGGPRVPCIRDYVASKGIASHTVPDSLYKFDFVSPKWSPDVAGWGLLLAGLSAVALLMRLAIPYLLKRLRI